MRVRMDDLIRKKRDGQALSAQEYAFLAHGVASGEIPDYQLAAWLMAAYLRGLTEQETADLTLAMAQAGQSVDLSAIPGPKVDKHSTGGVADTVTLIVAPVVASLGVPVAKMSGRGLGHTGGTVDKLAAIPGFRTHLTPAVFTEQVKRIGIAVCGQSEDIAPVDKHMYALRDVTATVDSLPLIASSIMSKKLASGARRIVLDVKTGNGAFIRELDQSVRLAEMMVRIGQRVGCSVRALVTDMNQPLGRAVGNALEVWEAIRVLRGEVQGRLYALSVALAAEMLVLAGKAADSPEAADMAQEAIRDGRALAKWKQFVKAQGGDERIAEEPERLPRAPVVASLRAEEEGYLSAVDTPRIGLCAGLLGAGRTRKEDTVDPAVGIVVHRTIGDRVRPGDILADVHARSEGDAAHALESLRAAFRFSSDPPAVPPLIYAWVTPQGTTMY
jgi:pyrimidine-nucleoside phosphorylase